MELPRGEDDRARIRRHAIYRELIRRAEIPSTEERRARFRKMRTLALHGSETTERALFNSLREWIGLSTSLIYSSEGTQFGITYPPYYGYGGKDDSRLTNDDLEQMVEKAREEFHRMWADSGFPEVIEAAVSQAHWADTAIVKCYVSERGLELGLLADPTDFAVGDEYQGWDQQEYMTHRYSLSLPQFWRLLKAMPDIDDRRRNEMWAMARDYAITREEGRGDFLPPALQTILTAATTPNMIGTVVNYADSQLAVPRSKDPVVNMVELWVRDDRATEICDDCGERKEYWRHNWKGDIGGHAFKGSEKYVSDWRVVTQFDANVQEDILWDPVNPMGVEGHPFFGLNLGDKDQAAGYIYGVAPMEHLITNQLWREGKLRELNLRDDLDVNPPMSAYGVPMRDGETTKGYRKPGADIPLSSPQAKVEFHRPPQLADKFEFLREIDAERRLLQGIPHQIAQTDANVRSGEQAMTQAMMGAGPTLMRAMAVERFMSQIATYALRVHRNMLDRFLVKNDGSRFLLRQMPGDFIAKVWAHSASPIYTENLKQIALIAHKQGLLSDHATLRYLNLPGTDMLLREVEKMEKAKAERSQEVLDLKKTEVEAKKLKALK